MNRLAIICVVLICLPLSLYAQSNIEVKSELQQLIQTQQTTEATLQTTNQATPQALDIRLGLESYLCKSWRSCAASVFRA